jgi:hypothetical protein
MDRPGETVRDDEPASGGDTDGAGSVVLGVDRSADGGVYARTAADIGALFGLGQSVGDPMRWSPPPEGEDTPPCPA